MIATFLAQAREQAAKDVSLSIHAHPTSYRADEWGVTITLYKDFTVKVSSLYVQCKSYADANAQSEAV